MSEKSDEELTAGERLLRAIFGKPDPDAAPSSPQAPDAEEGQR